jgi:hypothetical protein
VIGDQLVHASLFAGMVAFRQDNVCSIDRLLATRR